MKYIRLVFIPIFALLIGISISCERDDICPESTPTTSRLVIDLFDFNNQENKKNAFNLIVADLDNRVLNDYFLTTSNNLLLPLNTNENTTTFRLIKDAKVDDDGFITEGNEDILVINYTRKEVYVSRACGYKTIFENVGVVVQDDGDKWILGNPINLTENEPIEDENEAHFNLFH
ncbi:DUF6452 family protein [Seonamhaeicola sp. ML3]|uniref:DUF6452 family protein n=1 Tax=Seonamhaeicola sp. ML3 TaxID=2937786 RepID=UPI00200DD51D|nr:DUF6452 family protein [Seonamhaeicola sp. ML3]